MTQLALAHEAHVADLKRILGRTAYQGLLQHLGDALAAPSRRAKG
jgi:hypothetical protein